MTDAPVPAASVAMLLARPLLFSLDAEDAHRLTLQALQRVSAMPRVLDVVARRHRVEDARLRVHAMGLDFPNPIGVAAGLDKDAVAIPALGALGFGSVGYWWLTESTRVGELSAIMPFRYTRLLFALVIGVAVACLGKT